MHKIKLVLSIILNRLKKILEKKSFHPRTNKYLTKVRYLCRSGIHLPSPRFWQAITFLPTEDLSKVGGSPPAGYTPLARMTASGNFFIKPMVLVVILLSTLIILPIRADMEYRAGLGVEGLMMSNSMEATVSQQDGTASNTKRLEKYGYGGYLNFDAVKNWEKIFLGGDFTIKYDWVNGRISQIDFTDNNGAVHTNVTLGLKRLYTLELAPRLGVKSVIEGLNPYFKFGFLFSHFSFVYESPDDGVLTKERKATWGLVTGAGIDYRIDKDWGVRLEYAYHWYQRIKTKDLDPHSNLSTVYNRVCPRYHTMGIALYYVF